MSVSCTLNRGHGSRPWGWGTSVHKSCPKKCWFVTSSMSREHAHLGTAVRVSSDSSLPPAHTLVHTSYSFTHTSFSCAPILTPVHTKRDSHGLTPQSCVHIHRLIDIATHTQSHAHMHLQTHGDTLRYIYMLPSHKFTYAYPHSHIT